MKRESSGSKKKQKKTGRGPALSNPLEATLKIIEMFSDTPSFTGLQGFETVWCTNGNLVCTLKSKLAKKVYFLLLVVKKHDLLIHTQMSNVERGTKPYIVPEIVLESQNVTTGTLEDMKAINAWAFWMTLFSILNPDTSSEEKIMDSQFWIYPKISNFGNPLFFPVSVVF